MNYLTYVLLVNVSYSHWLGRCSIKWFQDFDTANQIIIIWNYDICLNHKKRTNNLMNEKWWKVTTKVRILLLRWSLRTLMNTFSGGLNIIWNDTLNLYLVVFDLIWILKNHIGYNSWSDVPMDQRELCYRGYNWKDDLPNWNIEQEGYWRSFQARSTAITCHKWICSFRNVLLEYQIFLTMNYLITLIESLIKRMM